MKTFIENLKDELDVVKQDMFDLLDNSRINFRRNYSGPGLIVLGSEYHWDTATDKEQSLQINLNKKYKQWIGIFNFLVENASNTLKQEITKADDLIIKYIEKTGGYSVPTSIAESKTNFENSIKIFYNTLKIYSENGDKNTIVIPDTNALIFTPDPSSYKSLVGVNKFTMIILPTVLSELDELKIRSNQDFRDKIKSVITRFKGYRNQGSLHEGVTVDKTITIKMIASEPKPHESLSWLDFDNNDDKIIASSLAIQRENPSSIVCIVTGDINLQNKAHMARIAYVDM